MGYAYFFAKKNRYPREDVPLTLLSFWRVFRRAVLPLLMPVIIVGGIFSGIFTATESAVVPVVYSLFIGFFVYRELSLSRIPAIFISAAKSTASIMYIIGMASFLSWVITSEQIPQQVAQFFFQVSEQPWVIIILLNVMILLLGCFIDPVSILILMTPIALPIIHQIGMDPVHFGVIITMNICIGSLTPPVGTLLFVTSRIGNVHLYEISKAVIPMVVLIIGLLLLVSLVPDTVLYLPEMFGSGG